MRELGGHPLPWGLRPPGPPLCPPSLALGLPAFWVPLVAGLLMRATRPFFFILGAHPPNPWEGASPPPPPFPALVGLGLASVLGPTRSGFAKVGNSPPLLNLCGDTPHTPCHGGFAPLDPPLPTLVGLGFARVLGPIRRLTSPPPNFPPSLVGKGVRGLGREGTSPKPPGRGLRPLHPGFNVRA